MTKDILNVKEFEPKYNDYPLTVPKSGHDGENYAYMSIPQTKNEQYLYPFFIENKPMLVQGVGEKLNDIKLNLDTNLRYLVRHIHDNNKKINHEHIEFITLKLTLNELTFVC